MPKKAKKKAKPDATNQDMYLKMMVHGPVGVGKSTLGVSGFDDPRLTPGLFLDFEGGRLAIRSKTRYIDLEDVGKLEPEEGRLDAVSIQSWADFVKVHRLLSVDEPPYKYVCIDSLTEVGSLSLMGIVGTTLMQQISTDPASIELQHFGKHNAQMEALVKAYRDLAVHVLLVCGTNAKKNPSTKVDQLMPMLVGQQVTKLPGLVDVVGFMEVDEEVAEVDEPENDIETGDEVTFRVLHTAPSQKYIAKDRSEGESLGGDLREPTLPMILDLLEL